LAPEPSESAWLAAWDALPEPVWLLDTDGRIRQCNEAAQQAYGRQIIGRHCWEVVHCTTEPLAECPFFAMRQSGCRESSEVFADARWLACTVDPLRDAQGNLCGAVHILRDITLRKQQQMAEQQQAEQLLRNANRTLQAIRDCHEAMLRASTERELLNAICSIIVSSGGERMAWVGMAEKSPRKTVRAVASAGVSTGHLRNARVTWALTPHGRGPMGTAIRTGQPSLCRNTLTDPNFAPWRESARRHGYGSVLGLPLKTGQECFGGLAIYAHKPDAFDTAEQELLMSLANDLALGISNLRLRAERERLEDEIFNSIEREQERIGRDLHDSLCQQLVGAKFRSGYLQKLCANRAPEAAREAAELESMLSQAIQQARDLARGLNPEKVTAAGLAAALETLTHEVEAAHRVRCFCQFSKPVTIPDQHAAVQLYRIAQEAVQNALKHAGAKNILLSLARLKNTVVLTIKDDGAGLPRLHPKSGMGLNNMRTRAKLAGGRLEIRRRPPGGTAVTCELPLPEKNDHDPVS
jgi:PAS domain S-box-containing protein